MYRMCSIKKSEWSSDLGACELLTFPTGMLKPDGTGTWKIQKIVQINGPSSFSRVSADWLQECEMTIMIPTDRDRLQQFSPFRMIPLNHTTPESLYNGCK